MDKLSLKLSTTPKVRDQAAMDKLPSVVGRNLSSNTKTLTVADFENDTAFSRSL